MADMSDTEWLAATAEKRRNVADTELAAAASTVPQATSAVARPSLTDLRAERMARLGERPGVEFHTEGLGPLETLWTEARNNKNAQVQYLANRFGPENVRLNDYDEPVVTIKNPDTGKPEDYPLNPRDLTVNRLVALARFAPDVAGSILMTRGGARGVFAQALRGAVGSELGGAARDLAVQGADEGVTPASVKSVAVQHAGNIPVDMLADLGLAGVVKIGQAVPHLVSGRIPNPLASTSVMQPADKMLTAEGVAAAKRLKDKTGIDMALRPSEVTGIPLWAMMEMYLERLPASATPMIAGKIKREQASKAVQEWLVNPATLPTDEEVGRRGLSALKASVEPYQKDVALAELAAEANKKGMARVTGMDRTTAEDLVRNKLISDQQAKILKQFSVTDIPANGVPLSETGDLLRSRFLAARDEFKAEAGKRYDAFFEHPLSKERIIPGDRLKASIDALRKELPAVEKTIPEATGQLDAAGNPIMQDVTKVVPFGTPVRGRLDELSSKLAGGKVSINDLKQIRTDIDDAIKIGEAIPGVKPGRLKATYKAVSDAIEGGLEDIGDKDLKALWTDATGYYKANVNRFTEKNVAAFAREAEQTSAIGNAQMVRKAIGSEDVYKAMRSFYGDASSEIGAFHKTVRNSVLEESLGAGDTIDGGRLVTQLRSLRTSNPVLFKDAFGSKGTAFLRAAEQLQEFSHKLPIEEVEKLMNPATKAVPGPVALIGLQAAQKRLAQEYENQVIAKFLKGNLPAAQIEPDKFVAFLPQAKLSDVRDVMARIVREDPAVAEQIQRKSVLSLLGEARRSPQPRDALAKLQGEPGDLISGTGISAALGRGDQLEKYKVLLGDLYEPLVDYAKTELLSEERRRVAGGVGLLAPGSAMNSFIKAMTPWEGQGNKAQGIFKELSGLVRDKVLATALSSHKVRNWLTSPYAIGDAKKAIRVAIVSQPFIEGLREELADADVFARTMALLKTQFGTAEQESPQGQQGEMTDEQFKQATGR